MRGVDEELLMIPGPTFVANSTLRAMSRQMINHRGKKFGEMLTECTENLKKVFRTKNDLFILTSSGTGAMEAAISNTIEPGDKVLCPIYGKFSERFKLIVEAFGGIPVELPIEWGAVPDSGQIEEALEREEDIKAVTVTHNETSTGVRVPLHDIGKIVKKHNALFIVDTISSMGGDHIPVDDWKIDLCISGSQKCFSLPPGLAFISVSEKAWEVINKTKRRAFYFSLPDYLESYKKDPPEQPYTPALTFYYALQNSLRLLLDEGLENVIARHHKMAQATREAIKALELELFPEREETCSVTVTAVKIPKSVQDKELRGNIQKDHGILISGGQSALKGKIFRIGHMGHVTDKEILMTIYALEQSLKKLGQRIELGAGVEAAMKVFM
ncbi:MAG: pyridoxal-phosphate-dependent aminotransferase family protein [Candidatus Jordarchaeum sp.]|uniref:pyridoxal-phosphate-dependent aminotransferase family protein n=1 Tax=Candidatus Jordarchaeum sp. TaxID=2823881 RepID=UPI0040499117